MNSQEFQRYMDAQYPNLWAENPVWEGYDIGPGWYELVRRTVASIRKIDPQIRLMQVKEKFGMLRIYIECGASKEVHKILDDAEGESTGICDQCGEPGEPVCVNGWTCTRCEAHRE